MIIIICKNMPTKALSEIHEVIFISPRAYVSVFPDKACSRHALTFLYPGKQSITMVTYDA